MVLGLKVQEMQEVQGVFRIAEPSSSFELVSDLSQLGLRYVRVMSRLGSLFGSWIE